jgi:hypothetical protein
MQISYLAPQDAAAQSDFLKINILALSIYFYTLLIYALLTMSFLKKNAIATVHMLFCFF